MPKSTINVAAEGSEPALLLLDTHIAIWLAQTSQRLEAATLSKIEKAFHKGNLCLSPISAWEIGMLTSQHKLELPQSPLSWFNGFIEQFGIDILEITPEIAITSNFLPGKLHRDPADRILIATAIFHSAAIVTADRNIIAYSKHGFVDVLAC